MFLYSDWRSLVGLADVEIWLYRTSGQRSGSSAGAAAATAAARTLVQTPASLHVKDTVWLSFKKSSIDAEQKKLFQKLNIDFI